MGQTVCGICHLSLDLQKEIHDLFTVTFGYSLAMDMCVRMHILFTLSAIVVKNKTKTKLSRYLTIMTQNKEFICSFICDHVLCFPICSTYITLELKHFIQDIGKSVFP